MKKLIDIGFWLCTLIYLVITFSFTSKKQDAVVCSAVKIRITDSTQSHFVRAKDISDVLESLKIRIVGEPMASLNTLAMEEAILSISAVRQAKVYKTTGGQLFIEVTQRRPILRVINAWNESYYIDEEGYLMPWSAGFSAFVPVANGNIRYRIIRKNTLNVHDSSAAVLSDLYRFAAFLQEDRFWGAQIEQIYVNQKREYELIPRVGAHVILLGPADEFETKLANLKKLYERGFGEAGWNAYHTINLKFKNQIICTRRQ